MKKYEYIAIGGETSITSETIIGKRILSVMCDGSGCSPIVTTMPVTDKSVSYDNYAGTIFFPFILEALSDVVILYDDDPSVCFKVSLPVFSLPDIIAGNEYSASFYIKGTKPFTLTSIIKPSWMAITLSDDKVIFSGTPSISDAGSANVSFTVNNPCGSSVSFSESFNVTIEPAIFTAPTDGTGDRLTYSENANLSGTAGVTVTVTLDNLINANGGILKVNGATASEGDTYNILLSVNGGQMKVEIDGINNPGSAILGHFTITAVSNGTIGIVKTYSISKVF